MTLQEARKIKREILKDKIKARLYKYDPEKYKHFKGFVNKPIPLSEVLELYDAVKTIADHERGHSLFEMPDTLFRDFSNFKN